MAATSHKKRPFKATAYFSWSYDKGTDTMVIRLEDARVARSQQVGRNVLVDYGKDGNVIGRTETNASKRHPSHLLDGLRGPQLTVATAAKKIIRSEVTLRAQIRKGRIDAQKMGRDWYVWEADLKGYLASLGPSGGRPAGRRNHTRRKRDIR